MKRHHPRLPEPPIWSIPSLWPGGTVLCIGGGPSLTESDCCYAAHRVDGIIGINDAYRVYPALHILYACDHKWWQWHWDSVLLRAPLAKRVTGQRQAKLEFPDLNLLQVAQHPGWSIRPDTVYGGGHGGYQAINLAMLAGAARIILLGYDMQPATAELSKLRKLVMGANHWFGEHPDKSRQDFTVWLEAFKGTNALALQQGVKIINCTRATALKEFEQMPLEQALP